MQPGRFYQRPANRFFLSVAHSNEKEIRMPFAIIVHGGAGNIREAQRAPHATGIRQAVTAGYALLARGETALDAAQPAVMNLEDLPAFTAGRGTCMTSAGTMDQVLRTSSLYR